MKVAVVLVLGCVVAANAFLFDAGNDFDGSSGRRVFQNTGVSDGRALNLGFGDRSFTGNNLAAGKSREHATNVDLQAADQDFQNTDFNHAKNKQIHIVDQSKTSFNRQNGNNKYLDFGGATVDRDNAAIKRDEAARRNLDVRARQAADRDFNRRFEADDFDRRGVRDFDRRDRFFF